AHARLALRDVVTEADVDEALRLLDAAKASLDDSDAPRYQRREHDTSSNAIYQIARQMAMERAAAGGAKAAQYANVLERVKARGGPSASCWPVSATTSRWGILTINTARTRLTFV